MTYPGVAPTGYIFYSTNDEALHDFSPLVGDVVGGVGDTSVSGLMGYPITDGTPANDQVLKFSGGTWTLAPDASGGLETHSLLGVYHGDTTTASPVRGSIIVGNATPEWDALTLGTAEFVLFSDGTDAIYTRLGAVTPFSLGTQAAPSMTFTGDLDTGLSAASPDILVASAGGSAIATFDGINTKLTLTGGQVVGNTAEGASTTLDTTDYMTFVTAAPVTITLPAAPTTGEVHYIKDSAGNATGANRITIAGNGNNIDGNSFIEIRRAYGSFTLVYNGTQWNVV